MIQGVFARNWVSIELIGNIQSFFYILAADFSDLGGLLDRNQAILATQERDVHLGGTESMRIGRGRVLSNSADIDGEGLPCLSTAS